MRNFTPSTSSLNSSNSPETKTASSDESVGVFDGRGGWNRLEV
jgi:hypothetical protein